MGRRGITDRWKWLLPFAVLVVILFSFSMYQWFIPRTELEVRTVYHETPGGGGTGGVLNVNVLLTNKGNRDVEDLTCIVRVRDMKEEVLSFEEVENVFLSGRENMELKLVMVGSHYERYRITVEVLFSSLGKTYMDDLEYQTREDAMNLVFVENLP
ncbi:MAG: hypothetical protein R6V01_05280 [Thermoplasmatota archaeon]